MAKKNKRPAQTIAIANQASQKVEFNPDYTQVKKDLARIGMLSAFFIAALVVLSFFLK